VAASAALVLALLAAASAASGNHISISVSGIKQYV